MKNNNTYDAADPLKARRAKRAKQLILWLMIFALLGIFAIAWNENNGNPISSFIARNNVKGYLLEEKPFRKEPWAVESVRYDPKGEGSYYVKVRYEDSKDQWFEMQTDTRGEILSDSYSNIESGQNTSLRLQEAYKELCRSALQSDSFGYDLISAKAELLIYPASMITDSFKPPFYWVREHLVLNEDYDVSEAGKDIGVISISVKSDDISPEAAADFLLHFKEQMDARNASFRTVSFMLSDPEDSSAFVKVHDFASQDITDDGLAEKIAAKMETN